MPAPKRKRTRKGIYIPSHYHRDKENRRYHIKAHYSFGQTKNQKWKKRVLVPGHYHKDKQEKRYHIRPHFTWIPFFGRLFRKEKIPYSQFAIAGFILSFFGLLAILGLIFSILGLYETGKYRKEKRGRGLAIAGVFISVFVLTLMLALIPIPGTSEFETIYGPVVPAEPFIIDASVYDIIMNENDIPGWVMGNIDEITEVEGVARGLLEAAKRAAYQSPDGLEAHGMDNVVYKFESEEIAKTYYRDRLLWERWNVPRVNYVEETLFIGDEAWGYTEMISNNVQATGLLFRKLNWVVEIHYQKSPQTNFDRYNAINLARIIEAKLNYYYPSRYIDVLSYPYYPSENIKDLPGYVPTRYISYPFYAQ